MRKLIPGLLLVAVAMGFSLWAYPQLPAEVATHFNVSGEADGWSSRLLAALLVPGIGLLLVIVFLLVPQIDPRRANYPLFSPTYWTVVNAVLVLLLVVHVLILGKALGWDVNMTRVVSLGVGGLFILLGNVMPRIRPNWFMGIRTPWTLSSDIVWRKTHRFGGATFTIAGVCLAATALVDSAWVWYGAIGVVGAAALSSVLYSYLVWKREQGNAGPGATVAKV